MGPVSANPPASWTWLPPSSSCQAFGGADETTGDVILDARGLSFIDSSGLRAILSISLGPHGSSLRLVPGDSQVHRFFVLTGVAERLRWVSQQELRDLGLGDPSVEEADGGV